MVSTRRPFSISMIEFLLTSRILYHIIIIIVNFEFLWGTVLYRGEWKGSCKHSGKNGCKALLFLYRFQIFLMAKFWNRRHAQSTTCVAFYVKDQFAFYCKHDAAKPKTSSKSCCACSTLYLALKFAINQYQKILLVWNGECNYC